MGGSASIVALGALRALWGVFGTTALTEWTGFTTGGYSGSIESALHGIVDPPGIYYEDDNTVDEELNACAAIYSMLGWGAGWSEPVGAAIDGLKQVTQDRLPSRSFLATDCLFPRYHPRRIVLDDSHREYFSDRLVVMLFPTALQVHVAAQGFHVVDQWAKRLDPTAHQWAGEHDTLDCPVLEQIRTNGAAMAEAFERFTWMDVEPYLRHPSDPLYQVWPTMPSDSQDPLEAVGRLINHDADQFRDLNKFRPEANEHDAGPYVAYVEAVRGDLSRYLIGSKTRSAGDAGYVVGFLRHNAIRSELSRFLARKFPLARLMPAKLYEGPCGPNKHWNF